MHDVCFTFTTLKRLYTVLYNLAMRCVLGSFRSPRGRLGAFIFTGTSARIVSAHLTILSGAKTYAEASLGLGGAGGEAVGRRGLGDPVRRLGNVGEVEAWVPSVLRLLGAMHDSPPLCMTPSR